MLFFVSTGRRRFIARVILGLEAYAPQNADGSTAFDSVTGRGANGDVVAAVAIATIAAGDPFERITIGGSKKDAEERTFAGSSSLSDRSQSKGEKRGYSKERDS